MRVLRASKSPSAIRCRQSRSSAAVSGLGKDPAFASSRRENSRLWAKSSSAAEIMYIAPFPPPYELQGRPYAPVYLVMSPFLLLSAGFLLGMQILCGMWYTSLRILPKKKRSERLWNKAFPAA